MAIKTKQWTLFKYTSGDEIFEHPENVWKLETKELKEPDEGEVLLKVKWLSNDPAQRTWIDAGQDPRRLYTTMVPLNTPMRAGVVAEVVTSRASHLQPGDLVYTSSGWTEYSVVNGKTLQKLNIPPEYSPTLAMGVLGGPGFTAWFGLTDAAKVTGNEKTLVVSGGAGAVGTIVIQLAKHHFKIPNVIAIVGSEEKERYVKSLGADIALNYKSPTFKQDLIDATPDFVDVYFDNVGGWILDLMLLRMGVRSHVASCGQITDYNNPAGGRTGITNFWEVTAMKICIQGFIVLEYIPRFPEARKILAQLLQEGKLKLGEHETEVEAKIEGVPKVFEGLFSGKNKGKLVTKLVIDE